MKKIFIFFILITTMSSCSFLKDPKDYPLSIYDKQTKTYNWETYEGKKLCSQNYKAVYSDFRDGFAIIKPIGSSDNNKMQVIDEKCNNIGRGYYWINGFFTKDIEVVGISNSDEEYLENGKKRNSYNLMNKKGELILDEYTIDMSAGEFEDGYIFLYALSDYNKGYPISNIANRKGELFFEKWPNKIYRIFIGSDEEWIKELRIKNYGDERGGEHNGNDTYSKWTFDGYLYYMIDENPNDDSNCKKNDLRGINCKWYKVKEDDKTKVEYLGDNTHPEDILKKDPKLLKHMLEFYKEFPDYIQNFLQ